MSVVTSVAGSARSSSKPSVTGCSTSPLSSSVHVAMSTCGTWPAWRTGHFSVKYWPGGRRAGSNPAARTLSSAFDRKSGIDSYTRWRGYCSTRAGLRARRRAGRVRLPAANGLERRRGVTGRRRVPGAAADREGAGDRAARRLAPRRGGLPRADRARARRAGARAARPDAPARAVRDRARGAHVGARLRRRRHRDRLPGRARGARCGARATLDADELEARRIEARVPRWGREIDDRVLPAEAGLEATHVSFSKGCYPGQEPVARLHYRGKANRGLRVLELDEFRRTTRSSCTKARSSAG